MNDFFFFLLENITHTDLILLSEPQSQEILNMTAIPFHNNYLGTILYIK